MGLFELLKKTNNDAVVSKKNTTESFSNIEKEENIEKNNSGILIPNSERNKPTVLTAKLYFTELPEIDIQKILDDLVIKYSNINTTVAKNIATFTFENITESKEKMQFCILTTDNLKIQPLAPRSYQQNWHWREGANFIHKCKYELLITERLLNYNYKLRTIIFIDFLAACCKAIKPLVIYSNSAEKLLDPNDILYCQASPEPDYLHPITNIRMYKAPSSPNGAVLMDTIGLNALGLPDFEILFNNMNPEKIAELLLKYSYFIFDIGDNILNNEYLDGIEPKKKMRCEKRYAMAPEERVVIHLEQK